jgi:transglutaminase-like putative cysteine protease
VHEHSRATVRATSPTWGAAAVWPQDLAAWFEAYVDGHWHTFDPRNNVPRIGRILIGRGRDATDVAISTAFGLNTLVGFKVWADDISERFLS